MFMVTGAGGSGLFDRYIHNFIQSLRQYKYILYIHTELVFFRDKPALDTYLQDIPWYTHATLIYSFWVECIPISRLALFNLLKHPCHLMFPMQELAGNYCLKEIHRSSPISIWKTKPLQFHVISICAWFSSQQCRPAWLHLFRTCLSAGDSACPPWGCFVPPEYGQTPRWRWPRATRQGHPGMEV